jgi:hypothetical protein
VKTYYYFHFDLCKEKMSMQPQRIQSLRQITETNAVRYEISLSELQAITEDVTLFCRVPQSHPYMKSVLKEINYNKTELQTLYCIEQYPLNRSIQRAEIFSGGEEEEMTFLHSVEKRLLSLGFVVGQDLRWEYDIHRSQTWLSLGTIFGYSKGNVCTSQRLCYNIDCVRREHCIDESGDDFINTRYYCSGPKWGSCRCANPPCLVPGPHYMPREKDIVAFYERHSGIQLELDTDALQRITEDERFFSQALLKGHCLEFANNMNLSESERSKYTCIEEYPRHDTDNKLLALNDEQSFKRGDDPEYGFDPLAVIGKRLCSLGFRWKLLRRSRTYKWCIDLDDDEEWMPIDYIFSTKIEDNGEIIRRLCYNDKCIRRSHLMVCDSIAGRLRNHCPGGGLCRCNGPKCLIKGPGGMRTPGGTIMTSKIEPPNYNGDAISHSSWESDESLSVDYSMCSNV